MNFSAWSIRNPIAPILAFFMLMVLGWQSFNALPITRFPNIDVPLVAVTVTQSGAAPAEMETQVTKEIEDAVAGITGVKNIISTVTDGVSTTVVEFRMEVPTDKAVQDVKDAIDQIRGDLPGDVETPIVTRIDVEGQAIMTFAVSRAGHVAWKSCRGSSTTRSRAPCRAAPASAGSTATAGPTARSGSSLTRSSWTASASLQPAVNAQLRATNTDLGAGRARDRHRASRRSARLAMRRRPKAWPRRPSPCPRAGSCGWAIWAQVVDTYEELRSFSRIERRAGRDLCRVPRQGRVARSAWPRW